MSATVLARPGAYRAEDESIARAKEILALAGSADLPEAARAEAEKAASRVAEAVEIHEALRAGVLGWEAYDPDLRVYAEQARHSIAITKSAEEAEELAGYLAEVIDRYSKGGN